MKPTSTAPIRKRQGSSKIQADTADVYCCIPQAIAAYSPSLVSNINENVKRGRHARYIVKAINTRSSLDGKSSYDVVDFIFKYFFYLIPRTKCTSFKVPSFLMLSAPLIFVSIGKERVSYAKVLPFAPFRLVIFFSPI